MNVNIENVSSVKKKINFEIPSERVDAEIEKVFAQIQKNAAIKGFRKGKVPKSIIEKHFQERMGEDVLKNLINETCYRTLYENKIMPISAPVIDSDDVVKGQPLKYSAVVEVLPEVDVKDYVGLEVTREIFTADQAVIDARLKHMQENMAQLKPVTDRAVEMGDVVTMDFTGYLDGVAFENGAAEDFQLEIGSGRFIPGFEDQIVGANAGEEITINVTFPAEYGSADLAGKDAQFKVTVKEIKAKEFPALDDDFAKSCGEFETLDELQAKMAEIYEQQEKDRIEGQVKDKLIEALIAKNEVEAPESLVTKQLEHMLENMKRRLASQGMSPEMMGLNDEIFRERYTETAVGQVKGMILLDAVGRKENIETTNEDVEEKVKEIAAQTGHPLEAVRNFYTKNEEGLSNLKAQIKEDKTMALLLQNAKVTEVPKGE